MTRISRHANFAPGAPLPVILGDLACPACGRRDPGEVEHWVIDTRLRTFCEGCGAFVTTVLSAEQVETIRRECDRRRSGPRTVTGGHPVSHAR
jgi:hypothetical protein